MPAIPGLALVSLNPSTPAICSRLASFTPWSEPKVARSMLRFFGPAPGMLRGSSLVRTRPHGAALPVVADRGAVRLVSRLLHEPRGERLESRSGFKATAHETCLLALREAHEWQGAEAERLERLSQRR